MSYLFYFLFAMLIINLLSIFLMPKYFKWVMSRPKLDLLNRVKEMQQGKSSLQGNLEIKKNLLEEKIDPKEIEKAITAATMEYAMTQRNFTKLFIMSSLVIILLIANIFFHFGLLVTTVGVLIILFFYKRYSK